MLQRAPGTSVKQATGDLEPKFVRKKHTSIDWSSFFCPSKHRCFLTIFPKPILETIGILIWGFTQRELEYMPERKNVCFNVVWTTILLVLNVGNEGMIHNNYQESSHSHFQGIYHLFPVVYHCLWWTTNDQPTHAGLESCPLLSPRKECIMQKM